MRADEFIQITREALAQVGPHYYGISYFNDELIDRVYLSHDHPKIELLRKHLARHGERVFCYELYYKIRSIMEEREEDDGVGAILQGELMKDNIHNLLQYLPEGVQPLTKEYIPDFLLHSPPNFDKQEVVVEVKANPEISWSDLFDDLKKLDEFITKYLYKIGLMLIVNSPVDHVLPLIQNRGGQLRDSIQSPQQIIIMVKHSQDADLWETSLAQIFEG